MPQPSNNLPDWQHYAREGRTIAADPAGLDAALAKPHATEAQAESGAPMPHDPEAVYVGFTENEAIVRTKHQDHAAHYPKLGFIDATLLALVSTGRSPVEIAEYAVVLANRGVQRNVLATRLHRNPTRQA